MRPHTFYKMIGTALLSAVLLYPVSAFSAPLESCTVDSSGPEDIYTFTQKITKDNGGAPYLEQAKADFFWNYSYYSVDGGWMHDFPFLSKSGDVTVVSCTVLDVDKANINITSAKLDIEAYDVDSEPSHGTGGEYDGLFLDGKRMDPGLLQGHNGATVSTIFDVSLSAITDNDNGYEPEGYGVSIVTPQGDTWEHTLKEGNSVKYDNDQGTLYFHLDIDMNHDGTHWATRLNHSLLTVTFTVPIIQNIPPEVTVRITDVDNDEFLSNIAFDDDILVADATATDSEDGTLDPETDVTYRWYVDVGQGSFVDADFAGRGAQTGKTLPASATEAGDKWKVEVIATDSDGAVSDKVISTIIEIGYANAYPPIGTVNTLLFEDNWPTLGDYDMNDMVIYYRVESDADSEGNITEFIFFAEAVARGAGFSN
ncbi:MAG: LruC domain-containing protein, partial [Thermodesulfobacteriota bacterium]